MTNKEKTELILAEIESYLNFDEMQREFAIKGIMQALQIIEKEEFEKENL